MTRRAESRMSLLLCAVLLATLSACADLSATTDAPSPPAPSRYTVRNNAMNPLGGASTVNPLEPSPG